MNKITIANGLTRARAALDAEVLRSTIRWLWSRRQSLSSDLGSLQDKGGTL